MSVVLTDYQHAEIHDDDWRAMASLESLKARARILRDVRAFFEARNVLEVETPLLSAATTARWRAWDRCFLWEGPSDDRSTAR